MLVRIVVKMLGGMWKLRRKCIASKFAPAKKAYSAIYTYYLQTMGSSIPLSTTFDGAPIFPHGPYGVFMSAGARVGKNCVIFQQVTIGSNSLLDSKGIGAPTIGDSCYVGAGVKIVGNVTIGHNVRIGANACVYQDVPNNCVITSCTQRTVQKKEFQNNKFYHYYRGRWRCFDNGTWVVVKEAKELVLLEERLRKHVNG